MNMKAVISCAAITFALIASSQYASANQFNDNELNNMNWSVLDDPDQDDGKPDHDNSERFRVDCRYHVNGTISGVNFCYASATYRVEEKEFSNVKLGVGCDGQTIFNDRGRIARETVGERISPKTAAVPAIEIAPQYSLAKSGTYESTLDLSKGRVAGTCYVHQIH